MKQRTTPPWFLMALGSVLLGGAGVSIVWKTGSFWTAHDVPELTESARPSSRPVEHVEVREARESPALVREWIEGSSVPEGVAVVPDRPQQPTDVPLRSAYCPVCGNEVDAEAPPAQLRDARGAVLLFDSEQHFEDYLDALDGRVADPVEAARLAAR